MGGERTRCYSIRLRRIPPEFCEDESLESCSLFATLLLYRLISKADDQGRLPGHPRHVRGACFPMRDSVTQRKVQLGLDELVEAGFVLRYAVDGQAFLQINRWFDLQGKWGQRRSYASRYPAPPGWEDWVNAGSDAPEVRARGAQDAGDVRPPSPSSPPLSLSSTAPPARLTSNGAPAIDPERRDELLRRASRGLLTDEEARELGMAIADDAFVEQKAR